MLQRSVGTSLGNTLYNVVDKYRYTSTKSAVVITSGPEEGAGVIPAVNMPMRPETPSEKLLSSIMIIHRAYQIRGHMLARTDPLDLPKDSAYKGKLWNIDDNKEWNPDAIVKTLGLTDRELKMNFEFDISKINPRKTGFFSGAFKGRSLEEFLQRLEQVYCRSIGYEFMHIQDPAKMKWLTERIEVSSPCYEALENTEKKKLLKSIFEAQGFEEILQKKFPTTKRFGLDGCEALVPFLQEICDHGDSNKFVLGMAHRGRLNVLGNVFHKPLVDIYREFKGTMGFGGSAYGNNGDVKYHLGVTIERPRVTDPTTKQEFTLLCNPSHLETVGPIVAGKARAMQDRFVQDDARAILDAQRDVLPIIVHGDSSVSGQGICYETSQMQNLDAYNVGGVLHVVTNNQIGFTTSPSQYMSGKYCTDLMKAFDAPVFHVNADDIEAVKFIAQVAVDYRNTFHSDVVVDLIGYRRFGHNEQDMPAFTNPKMYKKIANKPRVADLYSDKLIKEGVVTQGEADQIRKDVMSTYEKALKEAVQLNQTDKVYSVAPAWQKISSSTEISPPQNTGVPKETLRALGKELFELPKNFSPHPTVKKIYENRLKSMETGKDIDFGTAEALALGTLITEGSMVRIVGQDSQRGTFSHRHAILHDGIDFKEYSPFSKLTADTPQFQCYNSHLSEYGALGFELGYAVQHPDNVAIWEAQFGDFANGAQVMIDTCIASGEVKWGQQNGLIMYLPHGYDGMGPEHSSARLERFLSLCDNREDLIDPVNFDPSKRRIIQTSNMQIIIPTTPSNLYHALRRQVHRKFRKPLIVAQSKKLLKSRKAQSTLADLDEGTIFMPFYPDHTIQNPDQVKRIIFCAGQVYYDLIAKRDQSDMKDKVAVVRVEQINPLPYYDMLRELHRYKNLETVVWAQEEPMNAGMWTYVNPRLQTLLLYSESRISAPIYVGRDSCASTATGCPKIHQAETNKLLTEAFDLNLHHNSPKAYFIVGSDGVTMRESVLNPAYYQHLARHDMN